MIKLKKKSYKKILKNSNYKQKKKKNSSHPSQAIKSTY